MNKRLRAIGEQLLPAIAYGDAAGLPVETKSRAYIQEHYGRLDRLIPVTENPFYVGEFDTGTWSDDTQLSLAVSRALIRARRFDMQAIAEEHVKEYAATPQITKPSGQVIKRGWGGSTTHSVERRMQGVDIAACGEVGGAGNGVIMKMAPLAFWLVATSVDKDEAYQNLDAFTTFTHDSIEAQVATRVHYDTLHRLMVSSDTVRTIGAFAHMRAVAHEDILHDNSHATSRALTYLSDTHDAMTDQVILTHTDGKGFYVPETLAMAYGAFMAANGDYNDSVYTAVNLGGDTDSLGSIVGSMSVCANAGVTRKPRDFTRTSEYFMLSSVSRELAGTTD